MTETTSVRRRTVARVLLLDDSDRVLLFEGIDPWVPDARFWFTPGGGAEDDESLDQAAARELQEETGLTGVELGTVVWTRRSRFTFEGEQFDQRESFFLARVPRWDVDTSGFDALEQRAVLGHRWWTLAELASTADTLYPADLPQALTDLLRDGRPAEPIELSG